MWNNHFLFAMKSLIEDYRRKIWNKDWKTTNLFDPTCFIFDGDEELGPVWVFFGGSGLFGSCGCNAWSCAFSSLFEFVVCADWPWNSEIPANKPCSCDCACCEDITAVLCVFVRKIGLIKSNILN